MDKKINSQNTEHFQSEIKELFKELSSKELYDNWVDTFEIELVDDKQVSVIFAGSEDIKKFKKECKDALFPCIYSVLGDVKKISIIKKNAYNTLSSKAKNNIKAVKFFIIGMIFVLVATSAVVVLSNYLGNRNFRETFYSTSSIKVDSRVRIVQLSDMHNATYAPNNEKLLERIKALAPDIIICTGDIVDSAVEDEEYAINLAKGLSKIAPSYYIYGNNEVETIYDFPLNEKELDAKFGFNSENRDETALLNVKDVFEEKLESVGIKVLKNEMDTITVKTMTVDIYGVLTSNPSSFWTYTEKSFAAYINENPENIKITAIHEPTIFEEFNPEFWGDLMLCGHTHGGVMRVPVLGPLYTKEGGIFPERKGYFVYGRYDTAGNPLIVSSGLENSSVLRINNQPELVIVDINKF